MATPSCVLAVVEGPSEFALLAAELSAIGVEVRRAVNLLDALLHQLDSPIPVIVCDADSIDWRNALALFQHLKGTVAVVFLSRLADDSLWIEMVNAGAFDLLGLPCPGDELRRVVCAALKQCGHAAKASYSACA